jgi:hypothetical protein
MNKDLIKYILCTTLLVFSIRQLHLYNDTIGFLFLIILFFSVTLARET